MSFRCSKSTSPPQQQQHQQLGPLLDLTAIAAGKKGDIDIAWLQGFVQLAIVKCKLSYREKTPYLGTLLCTHKQKKTFLFRATVSKFSAQRGSNM